MEVRPDKVRPVLPLYCRPVLPLAEECAALTMADERGLADTACSMAASKPGSSLSTDRCLCSLLVGPERRISELPCSIGSCCRELPAVAVAAAAAGGTVGAERRLLWLEQRATMRRVRGRDVGGHALLPPVPPAAGSPLPSASAPEYAMLSSKGMASWVMKKEEAWPSEKCVLPVVCS